MMDIDDRYKLMKVKQIVSPSNFVSWLGTKSVLEDYDKFEIEFNECCNKTETTASNEETYKHQYVAARIKNHADNYVWKRATIYDMTMDNLNVYLIDEGVTKDNLNYEDVITDLPGFYFKYDGLARQCSLKDVKPYNQDEWSQQSIQMFIDFVSNRLINVESVKVKSTFIDIINREMEEYEVDLFYTEDGTEKVSLSELLISKGLASRLTDTESTINNENDSDVVIDEVYENSDSNDENYTLVYTSTNNDNKKCTKDSIAQRKPTKREIVLDDNNSDIECVVTNKTSDETRDCITVDDDMINTQEADSSLTQSTIESTSNVNNIDGNRNFYRKKRQRSNKKYDSFDENNFYQMLFSGNAQLSEEMQEKLRPKRDHVYSDDTVKTGYKPNVAFNPNYDALRYVCYGPNLVKRDKDSNNSTTNKDNEFDNEIKSMKTKIHLILGECKLNDSIDDKAQELIQLNSGDSKYDKLIVKCLFEEIASCKGFINKFAKIVFYLNKNSKLFDDLIAIQVLNELKSEYLQDDIPKKVNDLSKILSRLYMKSCEINDDKSYFDEMRNYILNILNKFVDVSNISNDYSYGRFANKKSLRKETQLKLVKGFLEEAIEYLKYYNNAILRNIHAKARDYTLGNYLETSTKIIAMEIIDLFAMKYEIRKNTDAAPNELDDETIL